MRLKTQGLGNKCIILYYFEKSRSNDQKIQSDFTVLLSVVNSLFRKRKNCTTV